MPRAKSKITLRAADLQTMRARFRFQTSITACRRDTQNDHSECDQNTTCRHKPARPDDLVILMLNTRHCALRYSAQELSPPCGVPALHRHHASRRIAWRRLARSHRRFAQFGYLVGPEDRGPGCRRAPARLLSASVRLREPYPDHPFERQHRLCRATVRSAAPRDHRGTAIAAGGTTPMILTPGFRSKLLIANLAAPTGAGAAEPGRDSPNGWPLRQHSATRPHNLPRQLARRLKLKPLSTPL